MKLETSAMRPFSSSSPLSWVAFTLAILPAAMSSPLMMKRAKGAWMGLNTDFADPAFVGTPDGKWYAYGTNGNGKRIQVATSNDFSTWTLLDIEALPTISSWETDKDHWAPDVIMRDDGKFVMYYSGESKADAPHHCVGTAIADSPTGPFVPSNTPFACPLGQGGAIDAAGFKDADGTRYVVYKVDGNSIGHGGDCNNGVAPLVPTPIMLQKVQPDGVTPIGDPVQILDRNTADGDGPLVEAPSLVLKDGIYYLFYSTHCFTSDAYDVRWATATSITGPYQKTNVELLKTGDYGTISPGGATVCGCGDRMLFHGWCDSSKQKRCMYVADVSLSARRATIV